MNPNRPIAYGNETPIVGPLDLADSTQVTVCLRTDDTYLKLRKTVAWANKILRGRTIRLTADEAAEKPDLAGAWTLAAAAWGIQFSGQEAILVLDLDKAP